MKKWYAEEYEFEIEVAGFLRGKHTERYCRNGEEIGDKYTCTYGCPVNQDGYGIYPAERLMYNFTMYGAFPESEGGSDMLFLVASPSAK